DVTPRGRIVGRARHLGPSADEWFDLRNLASNKAPRQVQNRRYARLAYHGAAKRRCGLPVPYEPGVGLRDLASRLLERRRPIDHDVGGRDLHLLRRLVGQPGPRVRLTEPA